MKNAFALFGWIVGVIAIAICVAFAIQGSKLEAELLRLQANYVELAAQPSQAAWTRSAPQDADEETATLKAQLAAARTEIATLAATLAERPAAVPVETPEEESAEEDAEKNQQQEKFARVQMMAMVDMSYGTYLGEQSFPPEINEAVRDFLVTYGIDTQRLGLEAMGEGRMAGDVKRELDAHALSLRNQLATVLNDDEMAAWDEFEPYAEQYLYENMVEGQLAMLAPGLSNENRVEAKTIIAQELVAHIEAFENSDLAYTRTNYFDAQEEALNVAVERLSETFDPEELAHVAGFRDRAAAQFEALSED
jgi:hypothetical protein